MVGIEVDLRNYIKVKAYKECELQLNKKMDALDDRIDELNGQVTQMTF